MKHVTVTAELCTATALCHTGIVLSVRSAAHSSKTTRKC